jgi:hypothetical protein
MMLGMLATTIAGIEEHGCRCLALGQHRHGGVVGMDALRRKDIGADLRHQRHQRGRRRAHPVGQRRDIEIDAFPGIDRALTVERQMQAVLGEQNVGEQLWAGTPTGDRGARGRAAG